MIFYVNNDVSKKQDFSYEDLIKRFIKDENAYNNLLHGMPFERCFLMTLPGTPEPVQISQGDWDELWKEFKRQVPKPDYKC